MITRSRIKLLSSGDGDVSVSEIEKLEPMLAAEVEEEPEKEKKKKKKRKRKSKLMWSEEEELTLLKGLIDHGAKNPDFEWEGFFSFAQASVKANVTGKQMLSKIRKLKRNFVLHKKLIEQGNDPLFTRSSDSEAFGYASLLWTPNDELQSKNGGETNARNVDEPVKENGAEQPEECRTGGEESREDDDELQAEKALLSNQEETLNADEQAGNGDEPVNENGAENRESLHEESRGNDGDHDEDECWGVRYALESQVLKGLSDDQKTFHVEKMMKNIGNELRKELSDEWKELSAESVRLNIKKLKFTAKVAEAVNDLRS